MSQDEIQTTINQMSLVMTIPEDLVKACKENDLSPKFVENILRLHNQQVEIEKALNELRSTMLNMAHVVNMQADYSQIMTKNLDNLHKHVGYDPEELISTEEIKN